MSDKKTLYVLPDANIFLEYPRLDAAEWRAAFESRPLVFEVCTSTVAELDMQRSATRSRLRKRSQKMTNWLLSEQERGSELENGASLSFIAGTPVRTLDQGELDRSNPDDVLVASAIEYQSKHPSRDLLLLTEDAGVVLKARNFGVRAEKPRECCDCPQSQRMRSVNSKSYGKK